MFAKYLLKRNFWIVNSPDSNKKWYIYHDSRTGGIYAQIVRNGVKIIFNDEIKVFNNFDKLEDYLDKILTQEKPNFIKYVHNRWEEISKDEWT